jgi:glycosyltransferase involved in cell wall biosynthesis
MKLLLLDQFSDPGGAQQALLELLPAIRERGWQATVGLPGSGDLFGRVEALGFPTAQIACGPYGAGSKSWRDVGQLAVDAPRLSRQVRRLAKGIDLIHVNGPRLLPGVALAGTGVPVVFQSHSFLPPGRSRALAGASLRRLGASVVAACEFTAAPWREFVPAERIQVIYNGVTGPDAPVWRGGSTVIGCIGRIAPEKGQAEFVRAAQMVAVARPEAEFLVYGKALFGDLAAEKYQEEVRTAAVGLNLRFAGWTPDVYSALTGIDLLLVPSVGHEATTRVILEAFAAGVPVIALKCGGIPEVVEDGHTGWLAESADQMAEIALQVLRSRDRMRAVSQAGREDWEKRFTQKRYQSELLDALERATSECPSAL